MYKPCYVSNLNPRRAGICKWSYNAITKTIQSIGAKELHGPNEKKCWQITKDQLKVRLATCDDNEIRQMFPVIDGKLKLFGEDQLCIGIEQHLINDVENRSDGITLTPVSCHFCTHECAVSTSEKSPVNPDQTIRLFDNPIKNFCAYIRFFYT